MSLRLKAAFILLGSTLAILMPIHWFSEGILERSFQEIENDRGFDSLERVRTAVINVANDIDGKLVDWAAWTDTYVFMKTRSKEYQKVNLNAESIESLKLNYVLFIDPKGTLVFGGKYDDEYDRVQPPPKSLISFFDAQSPFLKHSDLEEFKSGFLILNDELIAFGSRPIITSERKGPIIGTLIFAKRVSSHVLKDIQDRLKTDFTLRVIGSSKMSGAYEKLSIGHPRQASFQLNDQDWVGTTILSDAFGTDTIKIDVSMPRDITLTGRRALKTIYVGLILSGILFILLSLFLLHRSIIARVHEITEFVTKVEDSGNFALRLNPKTWDEIGRLSLSLNRMAHSLGKSSQSLRQSEERLRLAFDASSGGVWDWNMVTQEVKYDDKWKDQLGYAPRDLENTFATFMDLLHPEDHERLKTELADYLNGYTAQYSLRIRMRAKDGTYRWILTEGAVQRNSENQPLRMVGWHRDITDQVFQEELVERQRAQLVSTSKLSALGEMSAGVAHEINNPLAIIQGIASQIQRRIEKPEIDREKLKKNLDTIIETTDRIAKIVRGLRNLSRDGSGDPKEMASLEKIVSETISMCQERFKNRGIRLEVPNIAANEKIFVRPTEISQILVNLLNNASDAVRDLDENNRWVKLSYVTADPWIKIMVDNGGEPISLDTQTRLFQPFFTTKEVGSGTGLGLSIARGLAQSNGGMLSYDTQSPFPRFIVMLPMRENAESMISLAQSPHVAPGPNRGHL